MKKVSIIIPTYNREKTIETAVRSVLNQNYDNIEVIVVDDGSTDRTIEILESLHSDKLIILKNDKNRGACYSRNRGIEVSSGDYIAFQDSDDIWVPNKLETCISVLEKGECDFVFHQVICKNVKGEPITPIYDFNNSKDKLLHVLIKGCGNTQSMIGKRECFESVKFDESLPRSQDWELMIRIVEKYKVYFIEKPLVEYYMMDDSISKSSEKGFIALDIIEKKHYRRYYNQYNDLLKFSYFKHKGELYALDHDLKNARKNYKEALKYGNSKELYLKNILISLHLYNIVRKLYRG